MMTYHCGICEGVVEINGICRKCGVDNNDDAEMREAQYDREAYENERYRNMFYGELGLSPNW